MGTGVISNLSIAASPVQTAVKKLLFKQLDVDTVTALGTNQATATALTAGKNMVLAADGAVGVALPPAIEGMTALVVNTVSDQTLKVYAADPDTINAAATGDAFSVTAGGTGTFHCDVRGHWYAPVSNATGTATSSSTAELDYNNITLLGTLEASKTWTSDASLDTIMPTGGKLTVQSGGDITLQSGSTLDVAGTFEIANVSMTASAAELNYNDIATLGTLAASKTWTSDASLDTIMPTGGKLTVQSGGDITLESGSTLDVAGTFEIANVSMTATAAELNYNDVATLGTLAASKTWTSDASLDTIMPTGGLLTVQSGGGVTLNSGATLTNNATEVRTAQAAEHGAGAIGTSSFGAPQTRRWTDAGVITTQIKFDLTGLRSVATANDVIGLQAGGAAYIGRNVVATNGVIFKTSISVLETPTGGDNDVNVVTSANAALAYDGAGGTTYLVGDLGDLLEGKTVDNLVPALTEGDYFYLTAGTGDTLGDYTAGMYVLTLYGHALLA